MFCSDVVDNLKRPSEHTLPPNPENFGADMNSF